MSIIIGIGGSSGSGKTTLCDHLTSFYGEAGISLISLDNYYYSTYIDQSLVNFDHPSAFEISLLHHHLLYLAAGHDVYIPDYNFYTNTRTDMVHKVEPKDIILVEGIFALLEPISDNLDIAIYLDTEQDICFERKIIRDVTERGEKQDYAIDQYYNYVLPMFQDFILPTKNEADLIIDGTADIKENIAIIHNYMSGNYSEF